MSTTGTGSERSIRMLYLYPDTMGPDLDPRNNALAHLSRYFSGDFVAVWTLDSAAEARRLAPAVNRALGSFQIHWTRSHRLPGGVRQIWDMLFFLWKSASLIMRRGRYDVIVAYGPFRTAYCGWLLRLVTGTPLIVEIPGNYWRSFTAGSRSAIARLKARLAPWFVTFITRRADHVRLLYPGQVPTLHDQDARASIFHEFTPCRTIPSVPRGERYVLFIGHPWALKGVDVLIQAFNRISPAFPDVRLKIVGHCPDRTPYIALANGNPNIEFEKGISRAEAMRLMAGCELFVLPTRSEAMGRVLLEAMAAEKPIVATRVDGIPHYVHDGAHGLLVPPDDVEALAQAMQRILANPELGAQLGRQGRRYYEQVLSEEQYVEHFRRMVERVRRPRSTVRATAATA